MWRPVVGYELFYEVSDDGRVRSLDRRVGAKSGGTRVRKARELNAIIPTDKDYWKVDLTNEFAVKKRIRLHHLVAAAFLGPRPNGLLVLHKDDDKANNRLDNLYYGTHAQNQADSVRNGKHRTNTPRGEKHWMSKLKERDIPEILQLRKQGVPIMQIAARFGVTDMPIHDILRGRTWSWLTGLEKT